MTDFVPPYIHKDQFPNLGLSEQVPESQAEAIQNALAACITSIRTPNNFEQFFGAAIGLFRRMGIDESTKAEDKIWNRDSLELAYNGWQEQELAKVGGGFNVDIELRTIKGGYANIYVFRDFYPCDKIWVIPGACSEVGRKAVDAGYFPIKKFPQFFQKTVPRDHNWLSKDGSITPPYVIARKARFGSFLRRGVLTLLL